MALHSTAHDNAQSSPDAELVNIANYVSNKEIHSELAYSTARYCLMDALGCGILALRYPACTKLLGPIVADTVVPVGARVPGTNFMLDPILAAFNIGTIVRWLDFNDTWLAAEWGHPSDNLGAILACADYISRCNLKQGKAPLLVKDVLLAMIKAYEIQGMLALENSFNRIGFDHVILVRIASTAVATFLLGGDEKQVTDALSQAWIDGAHLRTYRHAPNTGSRKSWAAGDATSRAVRLAWLTLQGEKGYNTALSAPKWGFNDVILRGESLKNPRYDSYVMENILFKISYPAEFHAQTAVECAIALHPTLQNKWQEIEKIVITTHESAMRIINKTGALHNPADRDHCLQYMVAVALLTGGLNADDYENELTHDPRIEQLRNKMQVNESPAFTKDYLDPEKRSIANSIQVFFKNGEMTDLITVEYPIGHKRRRDDGIPLLRDKFRANMSTHYSMNVVSTLLALFDDMSRLEKTPVNEMMDMLAK